MSELGAELRDTSDAVLRDLEALGVLEEEKRTIQPGDPRLITLAAEVETLAARLLAGTSKQRDLAGALHGDPEAAAIPPIEAHIRPMAEILRAWREAEHALKIAAPGSSEEATARAAIEQARGEYRRAFDARQREG
jgi:hypothetical protein